MFRSISCRSTILFNGFFTQAVRAQTLNICEIIVLHNSVVAAIAGMIMKNPEREPDLKSFAGPALGDASFS